MKMKSYGNINQTPQNTSFKNNGIEDAGKSGGKLSGNTLPGAESKELYKSQSVSHSLSSHTLKGAEDKRLYTGGK